MQRVIDGFQLKFLISFGNLLNLENMLKKVFLMEISKISIRIYQILKKKVTSILIFYVLIRIVQMLTTRNILVSFE